MFFIIKQKHQFVSDHQKKKNPPIDLYYISI